MKKIHIYLIIISLLFLSFLSCKQKTIKTVEKHQVERYFLASDTTKGALKVDISVEIPVCYDNEAILDSIRKEIIIALFGEKYVKVSNDKIVNKFSNDIYDDYKETNEPILADFDSTMLYTLNNEHVLEGFSLLSDEKIYVYGINRYVYMGGWHGLEVKNFINFDLTNGRKITENDLFVKAYAGKLTEIIKSRIVEQSEEDDNIQPISNLEDTDYWVDAIKPNNNFYITDEGINYLFNPYEIGPYSLGQTEVIIPFYKLKGILKPNNIISHLIDKQTIK